MTGTFARLLFICLWLSIIALTPAPVRAGDRAMVAAANSHAGEAAANVLADGGSAVDAAIAAQLVLSLVEPQSSGIGGGAFLMHWDEANGAIEAYDGRETAPAAATPDLFLDPDGKPLGFLDALTGGRAVGTPGIVAMMALAYRDHGRLPWARLFRPAIRLARQGFPVSARLHRAIASAKRLSWHPSTRRQYFLEPATPGEDPRPLPVGHLMRNPIYGETLELIALQGPEGFYRGPVAQAIVQAVSNHANPGALSLDDLASYEARKRSPLCRPYRRFTVCGMPPPTSGGVAVLQILGLLQPFDLSALKPGSAEAVHLISEASRLAFADRGLYLGDSDFVDVPLEGLLDPGYLGGRSALIAPGRSMGRATAGTPVVQEGLRRREGIDISQPSTSHLAIVDFDGNAVSMTTSVESVFGARIMAAGFVLNNQLTDFSFLPIRDGAPVANAVAGGKRPRSSMSPTLVFDEAGKLYAAFGSPGGSRIIGFVAQTAVALLDWGMDMQAAISLPRHVNRNGPVELEAGTSLEALKGALETLGHDVKIGRLTSGLHGIRIIGDDLDGGADPRREGAVFRLERTAQ